MDNISSILVRTTQSESTFQNLINDELRQIPADCFLDIKYSHQITMHGHSGTHWYTALIIYKQTTNG